MLRPLITTSRETGSLKAGCYFCPSWLGKLWWGWMTVGEGVYSTHPISSAAQAGTTRIFELTCVMGANLSECSVENQWSHPHSLYLPSRTKLNCGEYTLAERADTLPLFLCTLPTPICTLWILFLIQQHIFESSLVNFYHAVQYIQYCFHYVTLFSFSHTHTTDVRGHDNWPWGKWRRNVSKKGERGGESEIESAGIDTTSSTKKSGRLPHIKRIKESCRLGCAGIFEQSMGARNREGIGLSYRRPARLHRLAELIWIDFWAP
jgi:hypothetical protein